jgi:hypothetical protein
MTPSQTNDQIFTEHPTENPQEVSISLLVSWRDWKVEDHPALGDTYASLKISAAQKPEMHKWGDYIFTKIEAGPAPYHRLYFAKDKTDVEARRPWKVEPGDGRHYEWPAVLLGFAVAEDPFDLIEKTTGRSPAGVRNTNLVPRQHARLVMREEQFVLCQTEVRRYQGPRPFKTRTYEQPAIGELRWVLNGEESRLKCLHDDVRLPAPGKNWNVQSAQGVLPGQPTELRFFPATYMPDWRRFVISYTHRLTEFGVYELVEEWLLPPLTGDPMTL